MPTLSIYQRVFPVLSLHCTVGETEAQERRRLVLAWGLPDQGNRGPPLPGFSLIHACEEPQISPPLQTLADVSTLALAASFWLSCFRASPFKPNSFLCGWLHLIASCHSSEHALICLTYTRGGLFITSTCKTEGSTA